MCIRDSRLSGYVPDEDIKIEFTGLRPGEKLYEEVLMEEEGLQETANHRIHIGKPLMIDEQWFIDKLKHLDEDVYKRQALTDPIKEEDFIWNTHQC